MLKGGSARVNIWFAKVPGRGARVSDGRSLSTGPAGAADGLGPGRAGEHHPRVTGTSGPTGVPLGEAGIRRR